METFIFNIHLIHWRLWQPNRFSFYGFCSVLMGNLEGIFFLDINVKRLKLLLDLTFQTLKCLNFQKIWRIFIMAQFFTEKRTLRKMKMRCRWPRWRKKSFSDSHQNVIYYSTFHTVFLPSIIISSVISTVHMWKWNSSELKIIYVSSKA